MKSSVPLLLNLLVSEILTYGALKGPEDRLWSLLAPPHQGSLALALSFSFLTMTWY